MKNIALEVDCRNITINEVQAEIIIKINAKLKYKIINNQ